MHYASSSEKNVVLVLHPAKAMRLGIRNVLEREEEYKVVADYVSPVDVMRDLHEHYLSLPHVVVVNWQFFGLRGVSGKEVIRYLRDPQHPEYRRVAIVAMIPDDLLWKVWVRVHKGVYVIEPVKAEVLIKAIRQAVSLLS